MNIRHAEPKDIVVGAEFVMESDKGLCKIKVDEVLRPDDQFKAFMAPDGCRYGLDGLWVIEDPKENHNGQIVNGFERIVEFSKAFDKRCEDPKKNYGIGAVNIKFVLVKNNRAVQFLMGTDWYLPETIKDYKNGGCNGKFINLRDEDDYVKNWDLGYHSPDPMFEDQDACGSKEVNFLDEKHAEGSLKGLPKTETIEKKPPICEYIGCICYYDGSSLRPEQMKLAQNLVAKGSDYIWEVLEKEWNSNFGDKQ